MKRGGGTGDGGGGGVEKSCVMVRYRGVLITLRIFHGIVGVKQGT